MHKTTRITLLSLSARLPSLVLLLILMFFSASSVLAQEGGQLVFKVCNDGVINLDLGGSAAQSVILMIVVILLTVIQIRYIERKVHY